MINCIHLSHRKNRESILIHGLTPSYMGFDFQREFFNELGFKDKILFTWKDDPDNNFKFIKDLIYVKNWLHPRNEWAEKYVEENDDDIDMRKYPDNYFIPESTGMYDVYMGEMDLFEDLTKEQMHGQFTSDSPAVTSYGFDPYYEHDNKMLIVTNNVKRNFKIIDSVKYEIDKRGKYQFKYIGKST